MGLFNWGSAVKDAGEGVETALSGVSGIINSAKGQNPELDILLVQVESEIKKAEIEAVFKMQQVLSEAQKATYDFALKYEGTADQVPKWLLVFRSLIRPITTTLMVGSLLFFMGKDIATGELVYMTTLPTQYWWVLSIVLGFWFGGKIGENIADKLKGVSNGV
jgi:hypothetical protein